MATNEISTTRYPALGQSVHIYNYLIDLIEDFLELPHPEEIESIIISILILIILTSLPFYKSYRLCVYKRDLPSLTICIFFYD